VIPLVIYTVIPQGEIKITAQKVGAKVFGEAGSKPPLDAISFGDQLFDTVVALAEVVVSDAAWVMCKIIRVYGCAETLSVHSQIEQSSISNESLGAFWTSLGSHFGRAPSEEAVAAKEAWLGAKRQREQSDGDDSALLALREKQTKEWYLALRKRDQASMLIVICPIDVHKISALFNRPVRWFCVQVRTRMITSFTEMLCCAR